MSVPLVDMVDERVLNLTGVPLQPSKQAYNTDGVKPKKAKKKKKQKNPQWTKSRVQLDRTGGGFHKGQMRYGLIFNPLSFDRSFSIDSDLVVFAGFVWSQFLSDFKTEYTVAKVL